MRTRLYLNRWLTFVASCLMQASAGLSYVFPVYAPALKELWGYHETQIATVGSCFNIGGYLAIPSGALYDRLEKHKRFGPRFVALVGSLMLAVGYLGLYAAARGLISPSFILVCCCAVCGGNSSTWFDTTSVVTNVRNFPRDRGTVVGILKAFVGLSASIYSSIYAASFASGGASAASAAIGFLFFVGAVSPLMTLGLTAAINLVPEAYHEPTSPQATEETRQRQPLPSSASQRLPISAVPRVSPQFRFACAYCLVVVVVVYQAAAALWAGAVHPSSRARRGLLVGLLTLLALLLAVPLSSGDWVHRKPRPEAVERLRRSLLRRLATGSVKAAVKLRRSLRGGGAASGVGGGLTEPLLTAATAAEEEVCSVVDADKNGCRQMAVTRTTSSMVLGAAATPAGDQWMGGNKAIPEKEDTAVEAGAGAGMEQEDRVHAAALDGAAASVVMQAANTGGEGAVGVHEGDLEAHLEALEQVPALPDMPLSAAIRSPIFWLLLLQFGVGLGTGLSYLNNLGSIVVALGGQPGSAGVVFVSLFSVANATGRLTGGVLSEFVLRKYGTPRTLLLIAVSCLTLLGVGGAAVSELSDLYVVSVVAGLAFGAHWGLIPAITSDMFGLTHFGSNYTALQMGPALGGYLLATVLTGKLYDQVARRHGDSLFCIGADCYMMTWAVLGGLNLVVLLGTIEMYGMSVGRYRRIVRGGGV